MIQVSLDEIFVGRRDNVAQVTIIVLKLLGLASYDLILPAQQATRVRRVGRLLDAQSLDDRILCLAAAKARQV